VNRSFESFARPMALQPGDTVRVIAPGMAVDRVVTEAGATLLGKRYRVVFDDAIFSVKHYLAGDDDRRFAEFTKAFMDPDTRAVICARGGYGAMRLLSRLVDMGSLPNKLLVGFSDITALHAAVQRAGRISIHGPGTSQLSGTSRASIDGLIRVLESVSPLDPLTGAEMLVPGVVEGPLLGGNLSVIAALVGTPYMPPLDGAVLCLEDVGERPYRLDRLWTHLRLAGVFDRIVGIALGEFTRCEEPGAEYTSRTILRQLAHEVRKPCALGFPVGHTEVNVAIPLGVRVRLDAGAGRLSFLEPAVSMARA
jgi:muramoyltetrapeptide carboxypeptidase